MVGATAAAAALLATIARKGNGVSGGEVGLIMLGLVALVAATFPFLWDCLESRRARKRWEQITGIRR